MRTTPREARKLVERGFESGMSVEEQHAEKLVGLVKQSHKSLQRFLDGSSGIIQHNCGEEVLERLRKDVNKLKGAVEQWEKRYAR